MQPTSRFAQLLISGQLGLAVGARTQRLVPTGLDVELLDAADRALSARVPLAVILPVPGGAAAVTLGAATVLRAALNRGRMNVRVAACSTALADRQLYDNLSFRGQRLSALVPRARISPGGAVTVVGSTDPHAPGRLFLSSDATRILPFAETLEAVVVDAGAVNDDIFAVLLKQTPRRAPLIYLTGDLTDARLETVRAAGGMTWSWDAPTLGRLARPVTTAPPGAVPPTSLLAAPATLTAAGVSTVAVHIPPGSTDMDDALASLWSTLGKLARDAMGVGSDQVVLRGLAWARGVFNTLALLPVSPAQYDRHVRNNPYAISLGRAADTARQYSSHARRAMRDAWADVTAAMRHAVAAADGSPRTGELIRVVANVAERSQRTAIVVRNRTAAAALRAALRESPHTPLGWDQRLDILGLEQLRRVASATTWDEMYLAGTVPRAHAALLATPPAPRLHLLTCGPREGARAVRQAVAARTALAQLRRETVEISAPQLAIQLAASVVDEHPADAVSVVEGDAERGLIDDELSAADEVWDPFTVDLLSLLNAVQTGEDVGRHTVRGQDPPGATEIVTVYLDEAESGEQSALLAAPNDLLTRRRGVELLRVAAKALEAGDTVVLVDRSARRDLRETISAKLAERPEYAGLTSFIDLWHERAARAGRTSGLTYREILTRMSGTVITHPGTVGTWVNGVVDGPADGDDITRFARAVGDEILEKYAAQVGTALRTMHRVDRKLGRWLASRVDAATASTADAVIDAEIGLHVADLLDSVTDYVVVDVDARPGRYAGTETLGLVLPARQADDLVESCTVTAQTAATRNAETPNPR
ncbi:MAG TPA: hypothetical protein VJT49_15005 [Amycolatopsis sp.]|uniref:DISARM anti-phage system protein DrmE domain-containing protein n=1 Tax=Amycolatopsis sp. TaxID=37632 RepID=UPI002B49B913|nr:hypothetical protein [Amycolatopsis sp.]HKS46388.1 hypothetical protein [Amycolatopsis sp.]